MKTNETGRIRQLAFEALTEYPDGQIPFSVEARDLYPEIFQSALAKSSERKTADEALELLKGAEKSRTALDSEIAGAACADALENIDKLPFSLARLGLYDILENNADPESVFNEFIPLYKNHINRKFQPGGTSGAAAEISERGREKIEKAERLVFSALFGQFQFLVWNGLMDAGEAASLSRPAYRKLIARLGFDEELAPPPLAERLIEGILGHRVFLDAVLRKFFRHRRWGDLPPALRNILRMGLYEIIIALAAPSAVIDSLSALLKVVRVQNDSLGEENLAETEKFLKTQVVKSARSIGRALAFQIIYGLAFTDIQSLSALKEAYERSPYNISGQASEGGVYSWKLVRGVWENVKTLDEIIESLSHNWRIERMGKIEITLLRMALYEMIYEHVPARIVISETLGIADMFGAEEVKNLVNGILDAASKSDEIRFLEKRQ